MWHQTQIRFACFSTVSHYQWKALCFLFHNANKGVSFLFIACTTLKFVLRKDKEMMLSVHRGQLLAMGKMVSTYLFTIPSALSQGTECHSVGLFWEAQYGISLQSSWTIMKAPKLDAVECPGKRLGLVWLLDSMVGSVTHRSWTNALTLLGRHQFPLVQKRIIK